MSLIVLMVCPLTLNGLRAQSRAIEHLTILLPCIYGIEPGQGTWLATRVAKLRETCLGNWKNETFNTQTTKNTQHKSNLDAQQTGNWNTLQRYICLEKREWYLLERINNYIINITDKERNIFIKFLAFSLFIRQVVRPWSSYFLNITTSWGLD